MVQTPYGSYVRAYFRDWGGPNGAPVYEVDDQLAETALDESHWISVNDGEKLYWRDSGYDTSNLQDEGGNITFVFGDYWVSFTYDPGQFYVIYD
jgi:hypothetical protein